MECISIGPSFSVGITFGSAQETGESYVKLTQEEYVDLVERLLAEGVFAVKKSTLIALPLSPNFRIQTLAKEGKTETTRDVDYSGPYVAFDPQDFTPEGANNVLDKILEGYKSQYNELPEQVRAQINRGEIVAYATASGESIWTIDAKNLKRDYHLSEDDHLAAGGVYEVNQGTGRLCLPIDRNMKIPVNWEGGFDVPEGGTIAIAFSDVPALIESLNKFKSGELTIEEALVGSNFITKFDIYGMKDGFFETSYGIVETPDSLVQPMREYRQKNAAPHLEC